MPSAICGISTTISFKLKAHKSAQARQNQTNHRQASGLNTKLQVVQLCSHSPSLPQTAECSLRRCGRLNSTVNATNGPYINIRYPINSSAGRIVKIPLWYIVVIGFTPSLAYCTIFIIISSEIVDHPYQSLLASGSAVTHQSVCLSDNRCLHASV